MRLLAGLLLSTGCASAHQNSLIDAQQAPNREHFDTWLEEEELVADYAQLVVVLRDGNEHDVVPPWQLLRQGTDWALVDHPPFAMPPRELWTAMVPTLRFIEDELIPRIGPVEVVSGFRTEAFNAMAGGSTGSRHLTFEAVDLVPLQRQTRKSLHQELESIHHAHGQEHSLGLGLYQNTRFHVDTWKARRW
jgi:hypothetical protein